MTSPVIGTAAARILVAPPGGTGELTDQTDPGADGVIRRPDVLRFVTFGDGQDLVLLTDLQQGSRGEPPVVLVAGPAAAARARAGGWSGPLVVEIPLDDAAAGLLAEVRAVETFVGIVVAPRSSSGSGAGSADEELAGAVEQGRTLGLLASVLLAGVATVRTDDPAMARRVRAVIGALTGPGDSDARMAP